jgi:hypothetical protein
MEGKEGQIHDGNPRVVIKADGRQSAAPHDGNGLESQARVTRTERVQWARSEGLTPRSDAGAAQIPGGITRILASIAASHRRIDAYCTINLRKTRHLSPPI